MLPIPRLIFKLYTLETGTLHREGWRHCGKPAHSRPAPQRRRVRVRTFPPRKNTTISFAVAKAEGHGVQYYTFQHVYWTLCNTLLRTGHSECCNNGNCRRLQCTRKLKLSSLPCHNEQYERYPLMRMEQTWPRLVLTAEASSGAA